MTLLKRSFHCIHLERSTIKVINMHRHYHHIYPYPPKMRFGLYFLRLRPLLPLPPSESSPPKTPTILFSHLPPGPPSPRKSFNLSARGSSPRSGIRRPCLSKRGGRSTVVSDAAEGEESLREGFLRLKSSLPDIECRRWRRRPDVRAEDSVGVSDESLRSPSRCSRRRLLLRRLSIASAGECRSGVFDGCDRSNCTDFPGGGELGPGFGDEKAGGGAGAAVMFTPASSYVSLSLSHIDIGWDTKDPPSGV